MDARPPAVVGLTRSEQKRRTRDALLTAARGLVDRRGLGGVSLREVAREAGVVPTAFYRHFDDLEDLARVLVVEAGRALGDLVRDADVAGAGASDGALDEAVARVADTVAADRLAFVVLARERTSGTPEVREDLRRERARVAADLRVDLARCPDLRHRDADALADVADLMLEVLLALVEVVVDAAPGSEQGVRARGAAARRLALVRAGAAGSSDAAR